MTQGTQKRSVGMIVAFVFGGCFVLVAVTGILAAIAIPQFISYIKKSKAAEAQSNLALMASALESYALDHGRFPQRSLPRTPATPGCGQKRSWPLAADPGWAELGFAPADPIYYSYEYVAGPAGRSYTIRAYGDLDCDGVESRYERTSDSPNIYVENELE